jgi:hypothetical protein
METTCQHLIHLLQSDWKSNGLVGEFFTECLKHLSVILSRDAMSNTGSDVVPGSGGQSTSSVLLECENNMPLSSFEVERGVGVIYTIATLCEQLNEKVLSEAHLPSLLGACRDILTCHTSYLANQGSNIKVSGTAEPTYGEMMVGGSVSLSIVFGLLSAIIADVSNVSALVLAIISLSVCLSVCVSVRTTTRIRTLAKG